MTSNWQRLQGVAHGLNLTDQLWLPNNVDDRLDLDHRVYINNVSTGTTISNLPLLTCFRTGEDSSLTEHQIRQQMMFSTSQHVPTREQWELHRPTITKLYRDERWKLKDVVAYMSTQYGFIANERMYKKRISEWDIRRYLRWDEREAVCKSLVLKKPPLGGHKSTKIVVRGQERQLALFLRHMKQPLRNARRRPQHRTAAVMNLNIMTPPADSADLTLHQAFAAGPTIRCTMYPPGEMKVLELICKQTSYICEVASNDFRSTTPLCGALEWAAIYASEQRYRDARILANRAGEWVRYRMTSRPDFVLMSVIESLKVRRRNIGNLFDPLELFWFHALDLSTVLLGSSHPLAVVLSSISRIQDWANALESAYRVAIETIRRKGPGEEHAVTARLLQYDLAYSLQDLGCDTKVESLLLDLTNNYQRNYPESPYRVQALGTLTEFYIEQGPSQYDKARRLLEETRQISTDPVTRRIHAYHRYVVNAGFGYLARSREDYGLALHHLKLCIPAAIYFYGEDHVVVLSCRRKMVECLKKLGEWQEAEEIRRLTQLSDELDDLNLNGI